MIKTHRLAVGLVVALLLVCSTAAIAQGSSPLTVHNNAPHGITAALAFYAEKAIGAVGYPGVFLAMAAESMFLPVPAEAVMPFAGFLVADGTFHFVWVMVVSILGSLFGSIVSYYIGAWGGRPFVDRLGRYVLLDRRDLEASERFFGRRGEIAILISRFIPVVRHLISLPAGAARMNLVRFIIFTTVGAGIYDTFLAAAGYYLRDHWARVMHYGHTIDVILVLLVAAMVVWYVVRHLRRLAADRRVETPS